MQQIGKTTAWIGLLLASLVGLTESLWAQQTRIWGYAPDYAGYHLLADSLQDGILGKTAVLDSCVVDSGGLFLLQFDLQRTTQILFPLGAYTGTLFVKPGSDYRVALPPYKMPTLADSLNPYYSPQGLLLSIQNADSTDINILIDRFEDDLDAAWKSLLFKGVRSERIDSFYNALADKYLTNDPYFASYQHYSYAMLVNLYAPKSPYLAINTFFMGHCPDYQTPAFWNAFELLFDGFRQPERLQSDPCLYQMVLLHKVAAGQLSYKRLSEVNLPQYQSTVKALLQRQPPLQKGDTLELAGWTGLDGKTRTWRDLDKEKIYIIFAHTGLGETEADLAFAQLWNKKKKSTLGVLVVFDSEKRESLLKKYGKSPMKPYILCGDDNRELVRRAAVKHHPAYLLVTYEGIVLENPAPEPKQLIP